MLMMALLTLRRYYDARSACYATPYGVIDIAVALYAMISHQRYAIAQFMPCRLLRHVARYFMLLPRAPMRAVICAVATLSVSPRHCRAAFS